MEDYAPVDNNREVCFLTGSTYQGDWKSGSQGMEGFGIYKFPNGSVYRGYFRAGKFHGAGRMKAASPYNFVLYGSFENGRLIKLDYMVFHDGLRIYGDVKNNKIDFSDWKYCREHDRRFAKEHVKGLKAFGSTPATAVEKKNHLKPGFYDTEEGIFNGSSGFLTERMAPFKNTEFIGCSKKARWIKQNCRAGRNNGEIIEPTERVCRSILENNIQNQRWANANFGDQCTPWQREGYNYFSKSYEKDLKEAQRIINGEGNFETESFYGYDDDDDDDVDLKSSSSFLLPTVQNVAMMENLCERPKLQFDWEGSLSIDMEAIDMRKSLYG